MRSIHYFMVRTATSTTVQNYCTINTRKIAAWNATRTLRESLIPDTGVIKQWRIDTTTNPGAGKSYTFEIYVNGAASGYQIVISGASATSGTNDGELAIAAGDLVSISCTPSGTPNAIGVKSCLVFESSTKGYVPLPCGSDTTVGGTTNRYNAMLGGVDWVATAAGTNVQVLCPAAGTIKNLYVYVDVGPGLGKTMVFTVAKNGTDTALSVSISNSGPGSDLQSNTSDSFTVVAGDLLELHYAIGAGTPGAKTASWGAVFVPDDATKQPVLSGTLNVTATATENYVQIQDSGPAFGTTESNVRTITSINMRLRDLAVMLDTAAGGGGSYDAEVQRNTSASALTCATITGTTLQQDTTHVVEYAVDDTFDFNLSPNSPSNATAGGWGYNMDVYVPGVQSRTMMGCGI